MEVTPGCCRQRGPRVCGWEGRVTCVTVLPAPAYLFLGLPVTLLLSEVSQVPKERGSIGHYSHFTDLGPVAQGSEATCCGSPS